MGFQPYFSVANFDRDLFNEMSRGILDYFGIHDAGRCTGFFENLSINQIACHAKGGYFLFDCWFENACLISEDGEEAIHILQGGAEKSKGWWRNGVIYDKETPPNSEDEDDRVGSH